MSEPCRYLEWDSSFFGFRIAQVTESVISANSVKEIISWCDERLIDCLYFRSSIHDSETVRIAEANSFHLVDIRVTLERDTVFFPEVNLPHLVFRTARESDLSTLKKISGSAHKLNRFYYDPHFPRKDCLRFYETWIENSVMRGLADTVIVAVQEEKPIGYVSCVLSDHYAGCLGLMGINTENRSTGVGNALLGEACHWLAKAGMRSVFLNAQGRNIIAQQFFQRRGFITKEMFIWYHKWFQRS